MAKKPEQFKDEEIVIYWSRSNSAAAFDRVEAFAVGQSGPIGAVWFRWWGKTNGICEILHSFVHHQFRRRGVRTRMHRAIIQFFPDIRRFTTCIAADRAPEAWLKKMGFKKDDIQGFTLDLPRRAKKA